MASRSKVRVKKTPCGLHLYTARMTGNGWYGWGNTPAEARAKLAEILTREGRCATEARVTAQDGQPLSRQIEPIQH